MGFNPRTSTELLVPLGAGGAHPVGLQPGILVGHIVFSRQEPTLTNDKTNMESSRDGII